MKKLAKILGFGFLTWLIPFVAGFFCYSRDGQPLFDVFLVKTIMLLVASLFGTLLLVVYLCKTTSRFLRESMIVGGTWLLVNWILDFVVLVPMMKIDVGTYFAQIGLRYLLIPMTSIALGYVLEKKVVAQA